MNAALKQLLLRWIVLAIGVMLAEKLISGIDCDDGSTLILVVLLLSLFNAILKPLLVLFTLPFIIVTMGLGVVLINALLFLLVGELVGGFEVDSFWAAIGGSLVVSVTNLLVSSVMKNANAERTKQQQQRREKKAEQPDDVIDI